MSSGFGHHQQAWEPGLRTRDLHRHNRRSAEPSPTMNARDDRLTTRANPGTKPFRSVVSPCEQCARLREALERLDYLWAAAGQRRYPSNGFSMPDARYRFGLGPDVLPSARTAPDEECGHATGDRDADRAFPLIDYLIRLIQNVREALSACALLCSAEARSVPVFAKTRTRFECPSGCDTPFSAESRDDEPAALSRGNRNTVSCRLCSFCHSG